MYKKIRFMKGQFVITRLRSSLIFSIIRESSINVTLQDVKAHVKMSGCILKLFPREARDNVRWQTWWVWPARRNKTIQHSHDGFLQLWMRKKTYKKQ